MLFELADIRASRVWQEAYTEGYEIGLREGSYEAGVAEGKLQEYKRIVSRCLARGMSIKEIANFMKVSVVQIRRWANKSNPRRAAGFRKDFCS